MGHLEHRTEASFDGWRTPSDLVELVSCFAGHSRILLDPCTDASNPTKAEATIQYYGGLDVRWADYLPPSGQGLVYVNPPYGRELRNWSRAVVCQAAEMPLADLLVLVPARTETQWFGWLLDNCTALGLFRKRLKFWHPDYPSATSPKFPSALFYFGPNEDAFHLHFSEVCRTLVV